MNHRAIGHSAVKQLSQRVWSFLMLDEHATARSEFSRELLPDPGIPLTANINLLLFGVSWNLSHAFFTSLSTCSSIFVIVQSLRWQSVPEELPSSQAARGRVRVDRYQPRPTRCFC